MAGKAMQAKSVHSDSSFDVKRVLAWQLSEAMKKQQKTKQAMARELRTSRSQLDRLLDPQNTTVSLETITRAASVLGIRHRQKVKKSIDSCLPVAYGRRIANGSYRMCLRGSHAASILLSW